MNELLTVYDGNNLCLRAYHSGLKELRTTKGEPSGMLFNSIRSFCSMQRQFNPTHTVFTFDWGRSAHRRSLYPEYKANRTKESSTGDGDFDLKPQFAAFEEFLTIVGVPVLKERHVEADDIIASIAKSLDGQLQIVIVSGDHDLRQLVTDHTIVFKQGLQSKPGSDVWYTKQKIAEEYGIPASQLPEVWALEGDPSDNIIGIPRVGPVTALKMIRHHGNLQNTIAQNPKCAGFERLVFTNYQLIVLDGTLYTQVPLLEDLKFGTDTSNDKLRGFLEEWEFNTLIDKLLEGTFWT